MNVIQKEVLTSKFAGVDNCWKKKSDSCNKYSNSVETNYDGWKCHENKTEPKLGHILFLNLR